MQAASVRKSPIVRTVLAAAATVALYGSLGAGTANAAEESFEQGILGAVMRGFGLRNGEEPTIEYRERPPLVVPPSRDLPLPDSRSLASTTSAWPDDPDVKQARERARKARLPQKDLGQKHFEEALPSTRAELDKGRISADRERPARPGPVDPGRVEKPSEYGAVDLFQGLFSKVRGQRDEVGTFKGEPGRGNLTAPPTGYQTPSPAQPYGLTENKNPNEALNRQLSDRNLGR